MMLGEMCLLPLVYIYVAVCMFCAVHCVVIGFYLLFFNYSAYFFNIIFVFSCFLLSFVSFRVFFSFCI
jgi:hypothetical protein